MFLSHICTECCYIRLVRAEEIHVGGGGEGGEGEERGRRGEGAERLTGTYHRVPTYKI